MRILVIQDEPPLLRRLAKALRKHGYAVDTAENGEDGLYKAESCTYDALVLDVLLPGIDGWKILGSLRPRMQTPVLMLTAHDSCTDRVRALDMGADDCLVKPFDLPELLARLRALIRRTARTVTSIIDLDSVLVDMRERSVKASGKAVFLTAREYSILEYLALHRGKVVSRTELYEHVLDEEEDTFSNLVDVHISSIRKKLGHGLIRTRRGQGYCIE